MNAAAAAGASRHPGGPLPVAEGVPRRASLALVVIVVAVVAVVVVAMAASSPPPRAADDPGRGPRRAGSLFRARRGRRLPPDDAAGPRHDRGRAAPRPRAPPPSRACSRSGTKAPPFTLKTPPGETVSLADLRGKAVLLEFFATWCPHCAAEAPHLPRARRRAADGEGTRFVVGRTATARTRRASSPTTSTSGSPFPALLDPGPRPRSPSRTTADAGRSRRRYGVGFFPTFYVIDPHGPDRVALRRRAARRAAAPAARAGRRA